MLGQALPIPQRPTKENRWDCPLPLVSFRVRGYSYSTLTMHYYVPAPNRREH